MSGDGPTPLFVDISGVTFLFHCFPGSILVYPDPPGFCGVDRRGIGWLFWRGFFLAGFGRGVELAVGLVSLVKVCWGRGSWLILGALFFLDCLFSGLDWQRRVSLSLCPPPPLPPRSIPGAFGGGCSLPAAREAWEAAGSSQPETSGRFGR